MLNTGPIELVIIVITIGLPLLLGVGFAISVISRRRWAKPFLTAVLLGGVGLGGFLMVGLTTIRRIERDFGGTPHLTSLTTPSLIAAPTASPAPRAEVASDEELASIASAPPKIELDSEIVIGDKAADVKSDRPDWIDAHLGDNQKLITSGPFTTKESCESDAQKQVTEWLWNRHEELWPSGAGKFPGVGTDVTQAIKSQHEELRDTSVGEMHLLYTLAEVTPEVEAQIAQSLADAAARVAQKRGVRAVSFAGAGVLSLVALTHVVLRSGGRKSKSNTP